MKARIVGAALVASVLGLTGAAHAQLAITNGNFETGGGNNLEDVTGWFDPNDGTFWHGTWQTNVGAITPNTTNVIVLGSYESGAIQGTASATPNLGNYIYQSIGTAAGASTAQVSFDWGAPNDDPGGRELGLTVGIYAWDGVGGFIPGDNTDLVGAPGVTLLDAESYTLTSTGVDGQIVNAMASLDISGAASQELFLRINTYRPANTQSWPVVDNVALAPVPEPATLACLGLGGLALALRRRRRS